MRTDQPSDTAVLVARCMLLATGHEALGKLSPPGEAALLGEVLREVGERRWLSLPVCNDVHSKLNATRVERVVRPSSTAEVAALVRQAAEEGRAVSLCGARHSMGGQQFGKDTLLLDLTALDEVGRADCKKGVVEAGAGVTWPDLIEELHRQQAGRKSVWSIRQKQTGADRLTLGGSLASNIHGRGLTMRPIIDDIEAFTLVDANGTTRRCSRSEDAELFGLAIGGYGCFGVITSVALRLAPRIKLQRLVEVTTVDELIPKMDARIADGCRYGDFQFSIDERSSDFLHRGVLSTYGPVDPESEMSAARRELDRGDWEELIRRDAESFLAWARGDHSCVVLNLHTEHSETGLAASAEVFRALIDLALSFGGSYFLTYHRWAHRKQVERAYPNFKAFLDAKRRFDPSDRFQSEWWRHYHDLFAKA